MAISPGTRLGPYEVIAPLGKGGMGEVYRARDPRLGREVAIKVLPPEVAADADRLRRFESEARSASALHHPHILVVHDVGTHDGTPYLVTELLHGETLRARLAHRPLAIAAALELAEQVARGLAAAHEQGIVHRDLKPDNLFLDEAAGIKILDFGLAKLARETMPGEAGATGIATGTMQLVGTPGYMSPEQVSGRTVDFRSDQFAFGCVLYEMLAGRQPFARDSAPLALAAAVQEEPPSLAGVRPEVPAPLVWVVERCLAKGPERRYAATADLARDLETLRERLGELAPGPTAPSAARSLAGRWWRWAGVATVTAALGVLAGWRLSRPAEAPVPVLRDVTYSGRDSSPAPSPDGRTLVFSSTRDGRRRLWLKDLSSGSEVPLTAGPADDLPRFSPDGALVLFVRKTGLESDLFRVPAVGGEARRVVSGAVAGDWLPEGRRIVFIRWPVAAATTGTILGVADVDGGHEEVLLELPGKLLQHPRVAPDGRQVALTDIAQQAGLPAGIQIVDLESRDVAPLPGPRTVGQVSAAAWLGNGESLVYSRAESASAQVTSGAARILVHGRRSTEPRIVLATPMSQSFLDVLGPGRLVLDGRAPRENLRELALVGGGRARPHWLTRGSSSDRQPAYSPDGRWVTFSSDRGGNLDIWAVSTESGAVRRLTEDPADDWDPGFTRDGRLLWSSNRSGPFEIWMAEGDGSRPRQVSEDGVDAENPTATPDGAWFVYGSGNPAHPGIFKRRLDGTETVRLVAGNVVLPDVSPDGRFASFIASWGTSEAALRVVRLEDGGLEPWIVALPYHPNPVGIVLGRSRWLPDGSAIAYQVGAEDETYGVVAQAFTPGQPAPGAPRRLAGFDPEAATESFAFSPDGTTVVLAIWEQLSNVFVAENVAGIEPPARRR
ncbi:MAG: serine/threonine-protein kinase [Chloroflexi bacterium]|nr:serine/threonine-protein kinase [Chloroflexota bacterium]